MLSQSSSVRTWCAAAVADVVRAGTRRRRRRFDAVDCGGARCPDRRVGRVDNRGRGGQYFGWPAGSAGLDMPASRAITRERLGWIPTGLTLNEEPDRTD
jgi:hypothetical protein